MWQLSYWNGALVQLSLDIPLIWWRKMFWPPSSRNTQRSANLTKARCVVLHWRLKLCKRMYFVIAIISYILLEKKLEHLYFLEVKLFGSHQGATFWCKRLWGTLCFFSYTSSTLYETNRENKLVSNLTIWLPAWTEENCRSLSTFQVFWILVKCSHEYLSYLSNTVSSSPLSWYLSLLSPDVF